MRAALTEDVDGVVLVDAEDRPQWMVGVWRAGALRRCLPESPSGSSLRRVLGALTVRRLPAEDAEAGRRRAEEREKYAQAAVSVRRIRSSK